MKVLVGSMLAESNLFTPEYETLEDFVRFYGDECWNGCIQKTSLMPPV